MDVYIASTVPFAIHQQEIYQTKPEASGSCVGTGAKVDIHGVRAPAAKDLGDIFAHAGTEEGSGSPSAKRAALMSFGGMPVRSLQRSAARRRAAVSWLVVTLAQLCFFLAVAGTK